MVILTVLALLVVFSIVIVLMGTEDPGSFSEPSDNPLRWAVFGRR